MESIAQRYKDLRKSLRKNEVWRGVDFDALLSDALRQPDDGEAGQERFHCRVPQLDTCCVTIVNGYCHTPLQTTSEGVVIGGLREAQQKYPELVARCLGVGGSANPYRQMNVEHYSDGAFVYVPGGCASAKPIQILSLYGASHPLLAQARHAVCVGDGARLTLIHCDDSTNQQQAFANNVTEMAIGEGASVEFYKMQNLNDQTGLLNQTFATMREGARLQSVSLTFNGGHIRNHCEVSMAGERCQTHIDGLYLNDRNQEVDNYVFIDHQRPNCMSNTLFKGILDDSAHGVFNGHVLVRDGAVKTEAYQSNRNILLTDKATIFTKPFLEIYNDDVKCSHGSTIGQIDDEAMFYLRSRGISEQSARTLLLYAFCDEVVQRIALEPLRQRVSDLVKQRLHGELTACSDCVLSCGSPCGCSDSQFEIDASRI